MSTGKLGYTKKTSENPKTTSKTTARVADLDEDDSKNNVKNDSLDNYSHATVKRISNGYIVSRTVKGKNGQSDIIDTHHATNPFAGKA